MSWQKDGAMLDRGEPAQIRASAVQQRREEVPAALPYAAGFHCLEERHDCEERKPKPKAKADLCGQETGREASHKNGVHQRANIAAWGAEEVLTR